MNTENASALKKFFSPKEEVLKHWYAPVDNFQFLTSEFYQLIEKELRSRKVPGLEMARVEFSEGGMLSHKREYLRLQRERLVFDICAAPFGTSYFFSFRFVQLPLGIKPQELAIFFFASAFSLWMLLKLFGILSGFVIFGMLIVASIWFLRNVVPLGLKDLDAALIKTPVIGPFYEIFFRKETYFREDTRLMYLSTVDTITKNVVDEITAENGIKFVQKFERKNVFGKQFEQVARSDQKEAFLA